MARYLGWAVLLAVLVPVAGYLAAAVVPLADPLVAVLLFLCPSHAFFVATAACDAFDACSLKMLGWVIAANVLLYAALAAVLWFTRARFKAARFVVFAGAVVASAWWARLWTV